MRSQVMDGQPRWCAFAGSNVPQCQPRLSDARRLDCVWFTAGSAHTAGSVGGARAGVRTRSHADAAGLWAARDVAADTLASAWCRCHILCAAHRLEPAHHACSGRYSRRTKHLRSILAGQFQLCFSPGRPSRAALSSALSSLHPARPSSCMSCSILKEVICAGLPAPCRCDHGPGRGQLQECATHVAGRRSMHRHSQDPAEQPVGRHPVAGQIGSQRRCCHAGGSSSEYLAACRRRSLGWLSVTWAFALLGFRDCPLASGFAHCVARRSIAVSALAIRRAGCLAVSSLPARLCSVSPARRRQR